MSDVSATTSPATRCTGCGSEIASSLLSCPACKRLVHGPRLQQLAEAAEAAATEARLADALQAWREALTLLPLNSRQAEVISARINRLSEQVTAAGGELPPSSGSSPARQSNGMAALIGTAIFFALSKGKLLLAGLAKAGTFWSMLASLGVYWAAFGWKFALGLILTTYVHEIGHVAALRRYGIRATAPMFIPGFGAVVRMMGRVANPVEDSRVGLAGPLWGLGATLATYGLYAASGWPSLLAIAHVSAFINLFNLLPVWQLDGSRGFRSLNRPQRWLLVLAMAAVWYGTKDGLLVLIALLTLLRTLGERAPERGDRPGLLLFCFLILTLASLTLPGAKLALPTSSPAG